MENLVEAIKVCYRHCWGELANEDLQSVYDICRNEGVNLAGCENSQDIVKRIFAYLKDQKQQNMSRDKKASAEDNVLNINYFRKKRYQGVLDKLMDNTKIDLVLYNLLARELLKFRYDRLKKTPITQLISEEDACSEEVLFIGILGSLCKQYFAYGLNEGIDGYPQGDIIKEKLTLE
jgi:hypothetical protein